VIVVSRRALNMHNNVIDFARRPDRTVGKLTGLPFFKPLSEKLFNLIVFKYSLCLKALFSFFKGRVNSFLIFYKEKGLCGDIKYMAVAANTALRGVVSGLYSFLLELYSKLIKKLIITTVIVANIIANSLKQVIILKNLPKDLKLFVTAVRAREER
jgi:hypothetical protein